MVVQVTMCDGCIIQILLKFSDKYNRLLYYIKPINPLALETPYYIAGFGRIKGRRVKMGKKDRRHRISISGL
jgi:hypothetical protein